MLPQILEVGDPAFIMDQANGFFHEGAAISAFVVSSCMTAAGYFIHLEKTEFVPSDMTITCWLGIGVDLAKQEFFIPQKKWEKFLSLATDLRAS
ncbi:hypothetical protein CYMTET_4976 [Cymbomonas tetramitiformis]|uniref:Uncharacterized protein n=1 Tax=Cymbomonas tetramitiformis TaxID=36881 RepID=A0AAE0H055_9CHLO|nr:hypothetical protein CYMTET_4976 [Cymbomonas tetramitiformis]